MIRFPLTRLLSGRAPRYLLLTTLWIVLRGAVLCTGLLLQFFFDLLSGHATVALTIWTVLALVVASEAFRVVMWYGVILSRLEPSYTYQVRAGLRDNVLTGLLRRPAAVALDRPAGDVVSRIGGDCDEVGVFAIWSASNVSRLVVATAAMVIMLIIDPVVAAGFVLPVVLVTLAGRALNGVIGRYRLAARQAAGEVSTIVGEAVSGIQSIKSGRAEHRMVARLARAGEHRRKVTVREEILVSAQDFLFRSTGAIGTGMVLLLAANEMLGGGFTVGDLALFVFYIQFVTEAVNALGMFFGRVKRAGLSLGRLAELTDGMTAATASRPTYLDRALPGPPPLASHEPLESLALSGLTSRYPGAARGVRDVSLAISRGTLTVVTGSVGAGKSTLVKAIIGMLPLERGEIRWNGDLVAAPGEFLVPPRIGYVPQVPRLFSGSLRDNLALGDEHGDDRLLAALRTAAFEEDLADMPDGLDTSIGTRGVTLSGGQVQRIAAARMVVRQPDLLVVDDLSNALDVHTETALWTNLLSGGRTVLAVSHRPQLLAQADQIILLEAGEVAAAGPPGELRAVHPGLFAPASAVAGS